MSSLKRGKGPILGVCAGIADSLDINANVVRIAFVIGSIFIWLPVIAYVIMGVALPKQSSLEAGPNIPSVGPGEDTIFCRNCGTSNDAKAKFCRSCGAPLKV